MSKSFVNYALFVDTLLLTVTGVLLLLTARTQDWWLYELHRYSGLALLVLFIPKTRIIWRSLARRIERKTWLYPTTLIALGLLALLVSSLALALAWTLNLLPFWIEFGFYVTPLAGHWYLALALVPLFVWHARSRWVPIAHIFPRGLLNDSTYGARLTRRNALGLAAVGMGGIIGLASLETLAGVSSWVRRFSGSRLVQPFSGNDYPVTQSESIPDIDPVVWQLAITGSVPRPLELSYNELLALANDSHVATIDCTLGWASTQEWRGVRLAQLLEHAGHSGALPAVTVRAQSGAFVILSAEETQDALIGTHVGGQVLSAAHGFPARLVIPTRRGFQWIKWINQVVVG